MLKLQVELKNYNRRVDNSVSLKCDTIFEMKSEDIKEIDEHRGDLGVLILTDTPIGNEVSFDVNEVLKDMTEDRELAQSKSPSKRFRDILWRLQEQKLNHKPTEDEFAQFYKAEYEKICAHYLDKFDTDLV
jgi:ssDNA-specific exonuclease RecJ